MKKLPLNSEQLAAVRHVDGPVVVVAGAGTGKTRTIAFRTAHLIEKEVPASSILAITFTNKAAKEMRERISKMLGKEICETMTVSTIHSLCARILREDIGALGRDPKFSICDASDQVGIVRRALTDNGFDPMKHDPRAILWRINTVKNLFTDDHPEFADPFFACVYRTYNLLLEKNNSLDFDDLLVFGARLLEKKEILAKYHERWKYIMVDEYQDINGCQYALIRRLASKHKNLYVVGDDDQSIYGWRGAQVENILNFGKDYKGAKLVKLERNYRSTAVILEASNAVIRNNTTRHNKTLRPNESGGDPITLIQAIDEAAEAEMVIDSIVAEKQTGSVKYGDFAILYRTNAQSRLFEEKLVRMGVSYIMIGGTRFFERREIKDVTSYLKALTNPDDEMSLMRIINFPPRGIGKTSLEKISERAFEAKKPLIDALREAVGDANVSGKARDGLKKFFEIYDGMKNIATETPKEPATLVRFLMESLDVKKTYEAACADKNEANRRIENVGEFYNGILEYQLTDKSPSIEGYLENIALMTDEREIEEEFKEDSVVLMTLHSAKGLEFKWVFLVGVEEGFLPHDRSQSETEVEEERRLFYVGMTRAKKRLGLSYAISRRRYGELLQRKPSRFLSEIPENLLTSDTDDAIKQRRVESGRAVAALHLEKMRKMLEG